MKIILNRDEIVGILSRYMMEEYGEYFGVSGQGELQCELLVNDTGLTITFECKVVKDE